MKRYIKKELLEAVGDLIKANDEICAGIGKADLGQLLETLVQCQERAVALGNCLESGNDRGEALVGILESYCENLYQLSVALQNDGNCNKLLKKIRKQLSQLSRGIQYDLPDDRPEIVFFPYKVSMWDSLESIWAAALEDESCDTYVVPIPYFDRKEDGSFGRMHYEGKEYPARVSVTPWEEYKLEEHRPDVIFIHNPYDDLNLVTSVHPEFYASRIKQYTGLLVYVPYFTGADNKVDKALCVLPGTLYSDLVIVQSEAVRRIYVKELQSFEREKGCRGAYGNIEEKVAALGSPKYDKVFGAQKEDQDIPESWKKIILTPDEERKKVVFYNTGITALLKYDEAMLDKIQRVFNTFKGIQNEAALIWRPHPLLSTTLQAMRPFLWQKYREIVERFRREGWGIYDDTSDLYRAVNLADFYYGDPSSVIDLFEAAGKAVFIENVEDDEEQIMMTASRLMLPNCVSCDEDGNIWFISYGLLCCIRNSTHVLKKVYDFSSVLGKNTVVEYFSKLEIVNNNIYVFIKDKSSAGLLIYDIVLQDFQLIPLEFEQVCDREDSLSRLTSGVLYKKNLYFIPFRFGKPLVRLALADHEIAYIDDWDRGFGTQWKASDKSSISTYSQPIFKDDKIILLTASADVIFEYSIKTKQSSLIKFSEKPDAEINGNGSACFCEKGYWMTSIDGEYISKYNDFNIEEFRLKGIFGRLPDGVNYTLNSCISLNGFIWVFQRYSDEIMRINAVDHSVSVFCPDIPTNPDARWGTMHFLWITTYKDSILAFHCKGNVIVKLDTLSGAIEYLSLEMHAEPGSDEWKNIIRRKKRRIRMIASRDIRSYIHTGGRVGYNIYSYIKKRLFLG